MLFRTCCPGMCDSNCLNYLELKESLRTSFLVQLPSQLPSFYKEIQTLQKSFNQKYNHQKQRPLTISHTGQHFPLTRFSEIKLPILFFDLFFYPLDINRSLQTSTEAENHPPVCNYTTETLKLNRTKRLHCFVPFFHVQSQPF